MQGREGFGWFWLEHAGAGQFIHYSRFGTPLIHWHVSVGLMCQPAAHLKLVGKSTFQRFRAVCLPHNFILFRALVGLLGNDNFCSSKWYPGRFSTVSHAVHAFRPDSLEKHACFTARLERELHAARQRVKYLQSTIDCQNEVRCAGFAPPMDIVLYIGAMRVSGLGKTWWAEFHKPTASARIEPIQYTKGPDQCGSWKNLKK